MAVKQEVANWELKNWSTIKDLYTPFEGEIVYFESVITGQQNIVSVVGDGSSLVSALAFNEELEIFSSATVDLSSLRITGLKVKIYNSSSSAIQVNVNTSGSPSYEYINAKDNTRAFFDGSDWRVDDGLNNGDIKPFHKNFGGRSREIPWGYVECDGTAISKSWSEDNGQTINDLNGDARFLRGGSTSGTEQADAFQAWQAVIDSGGTTYYGFSDSDAATPDAAAGANYTLNRFNSGQQGAATMIKAGNDGTNGDPRTADETRPVNMTVVYIMKV